VLATGQQKLDRMRDGRAVFIGRERVEDVTTHAAFRNGASTVASLYDLKADPARQDLFSYEEGGERCGLQWLRCRTRDDLVRRMRALKASADATYGFVGRSPEQVSGLITGLAMNPAVLESLHRAVSWTGAGGPEPAGGGAGRRRRDGVGHEDARHQRGLCR
jgi:4-hydroxyphenylacetate 3-monooxygenase